MCILTLVNYVTRYPKLVFHTSIETDKIAETLMDLYSCLGVPEELLGDFEITYKWNRIARRKYHDCCRSSGWQLRRIDGLEEQLNGARKKMLQRLCNEQHQQWHRFINPLSFAY